MAENALDDLYTEPLGNELTAASVAQLMRRVPRPPVVFDQPGNGAQFGPLVVHGIVGEACPAVGAEQQLVPSRSAAEPATRRAQTTECTRCCRWAKNDRALESV